MPGDKLASICYCAISKVAVSQGCYKQANALSDARFCACSNKEIGQLLKQIRNKAKDAADKGWYQFKSAYITIASITAVATLSI